MSKRMFLRGAILVLVAAGAAHAALDYEGFDYVAESSPVLLAGQAGGSGWSAAWINSAANYNVVTGSLSSPASPFPSIGGRVTATGGAAARGLSQPINLAEDGHALYFSTLMRKNSNVSASNVEVNITPASTSQQATRFGMTSAGAFFLNVASNTAGTVETDVTYLVIGKIVSSVDSPDQAYMAVYGPSDVLPAAEPENWLLTAPISSTYSNGVLQNIRLVVGNGTLGEFDEIRIADTWRAVAVPEPAGLVLLLALAGLTAVSPRRGA